MRAPRMWGVARDPRASLGRRGALGYGLMGVFRVLSVAAVESLRDDLRGTVGTWGIPRVSLYGILCAPMHAPRMWGVEVEPCASLVRQGAHGAGLVVVFSGCEPGRGDSPV